MAIEKENLIALQQALEKLSEEINNFSIIEDNSCIKNISSESELDLRIGKPSENQLKQIIELTGVETTAEDWLVAPMHASNNLIDLGYRKWHTKILESMSTSFIGRPHILDHEWYSSDHAVSFIFDCKLISDSEPSEEILSLGGVYDLNKKVVEREGYHWLFMNVAIYRGSQAAIAVETRQYNDCSTGSVLTAPDYICPNCSEDLGREVSFNERDEKNRYVCPHMIPSQFAFWLFSDDDVEFADYAILTADHHEGVEISTCNRGALPAASFIRSR